MMMGMWKEVEDERAEGFINRVSGIWIYFNDSERDS